MRTVYLRARGLAILALFLLALISLLYLLLVSLFQQQGQPPPSPQPSLPPSIRHIGHSPIRADGVGGSFASLKSDGAERDVPPVPPPINTTSSPSVAEDAQRRDKVREMLLHAWEGYKRVAWGANEIRPLANTTHSQPIFGGDDMLATMVDAADTLWLMGEREEYTKARNYIRDK